MTDVEELGAQHVVGGLAEVLNQLGAELRQAHEGAPDDPTIQFLTAEVELAVTVKAKAGGGVKFWVVNANTEGAYERAAKVKVTLGPGDPEGYGVGGPNDGEGWSFFDTLRRLRARLSRYDD